MSKPLVILYFTRDKTDTAKEVAAAIRIEGNVVNLVYASAFNSWKDCLKCNAVCIQGSAGKAKLIADTYSQVFPEAEVHQYDDNGDFADENGLHVPPSEPEEEEEEENATPEDSQEDTNTEDEATGESTGEEGSADSTESEESDSDEHTSTVTE